MARHILANNTGNCQHSVMLNSFHAYMICLIRKERIALDPVKHGKAMCGLRYLGKCRDYNSAVMLYGKKFSSFERANLLEGAAPLVENLRRQVNRERPPGLTNYWDASPQALQNGLHRLRLGCFVQRHKFQFTIHRIL